MAQLAPIERQTSNDAQTGMMANNKKESGEDSTERTEQVYFDMLPNLVKSEEGRQKLKEVLLQKHQEHVEDSVERVTELTPFWTTEIGSYVNYLDEANWLYIFGFDRAVVAMVGVAAESFAAALYDRVRVQAMEGGTMKKAKIFGHPNQKRRIEILYAVGVISESVRQDLQEIRALRNLYVHPDPARTPDPRRDARRCLNLFREVLGKRFDQRFTIREGKIVKRTSESLSE